MNQDSTKDWEELNPGFLERWGLKIIEINLKKLSKAQPSSVKPDLSEFFYHANKITKNASLLSFLVGFTVTIFYVIAYLAVIEFYPVETTDFQDSGFYLKWLWIGLVLGIFTYIELYLVYRVGLMAVCKMAQYSGFDISEDPILITKNKNILSRIALEIPDHRLIVLGIDPERLLNKKSLLIKTIIYKTKIVASNFIAKIIVRRILARSALRAYSDFIIAPITGFWDGLVTYITLIEMKKRLFTRILAEDYLIHLTEKCNQYGVEFQEMSMRAIASAVVLNFKFHPNLEFLLLKIYEKFGIQFSTEASLDNLDYFFSRLNDTKGPIQKDIIRLFQFCCAIDGKFTKFERKILKRSSLLSRQDSLGEIEQLSQDINRGNLKASLAKFS